MRKIFFINRYFYPDISATSQILTDLLFHLELENYELHVITSRLLYGGNKERLNGEEEINGVFIHRVWTTSFGRKNTLGRGIDYLSFYIFTFFKMMALIHRNDIVVAKTDPPIISVVAAVVVKFKKAILINWLQDLFPEVAKGLNVKGLQGGIGYKVIKAIRNWSLRTAKKNVVIGESMAEIVNSETNQATKTVVIHNWVVGKTIKPVNRNDNNLRKEWGLKNKFVVGYSGNLGRAHDYKSIFECVLSMSSNENIIFVFIGGGAGMDKLKELAESNQLKNIVFKPYQAIEELSNSLSVADVHIVTLEKELEGLIVPSKIYGILAVNRPVIFMGSKEGEIAKILDKARCGFVVDSNSSEKLTDVILKLQRDSALLNEMMLCTESAYSSDFKYGKSISDWSLLIQS